MLIARTHNRNDPIRRAADVMAAEIHGESGNSRGHTGGKVKTGTFEVHVNSVLSAPRLPLPDDDRRHDLLPEVRLPFLHRRHHHISHASRGEAVEATLDPLHRNDVEILRPRVVRTVHRSRHRETQRHPKLVTRGTSTPWNNRITRSSTNKELIRIETNEP